MAHAFYALACYETTFFLHHHNTLPPPRPLHEEVLYHGTLHPVPLPLYSATLLEFITFLLRYWGEGEISHVRMAWRAGTEIF